MLLRRKRNIYVGERSYWNRLSEPMFVGRPSFKRKNSLSALLPPGSMRLLALASH
jgi:hypothetical protein